MKNHIKYFVYFGIDYVEDIYQTMVEAIGSKQLDDAMDELKKTNTISHEYYAKQAVKRRSYSKKKY